MSDAPRAYRVYICHNRDCAARGARHVWSAFQHEIALRGLDERCDLIVSGCQSRCEWGPNVNVYPNLTKYVEVTPEIARRIVREHLELGQPVADAIFDDMYR